MTPLQSTKQYLREIHPMWQTSLLCLVLPLHNQSISSWDTSNVLWYKFIHSRHSFLITASVTNNMSVMFAGANSCNQDISSCNTSNETVMSPICSLIPHHWTHFLGSVSASFVFVMGIYQMKRLCPKCSLIPHHWTHFLCRVSTSFVFVMGISKARSWDVNEEPRWDWRFWSRKTNKTQRLFLWTKRSTVTAQVSFRKSTGVSGA